MKREFFTILKTTSSESGRKNVFTSGTTVYVPDFFITVLSATLFCFSVIMDLFLLFYFIFNANLLVTLAFSISIFPHSICEFLLERKKANEWIAGFISNKVFLTIFYIIGFGSIFTIARILKETLELENTRSNFYYFPFPFFHISSENLSIIKIYCCINLVLKSIPQLFIVSVFILEGYITEGPVFILVTNMIINIAIFSQTIATTLPIRKTPRVFTSSICILFNAFNKFMATMCACCANLTVFAMVFRNLKYYAFLVILLKPVFWLYPCWKMLNAQELGRISFAVYFVLMSLVFSFIYVHPFAGLGKQYYYLFSLLSFLYDLFSFYMLAHASIESISYYLTLQILMFGFLSCFGLLNILHKYREEKYVIYSTVIVDETEERKESVESEKNEKNQEKRSTDKSEEEEEEEEEKQDEKKNSKEEKQDEKKNSKEEKQDEKKNSKEEKQDEKKNSKEEAGTSKESKSPSK